MRATESLGSTDVRPRAIAVAVCCPERGEPPRGVCRGAAGQRAERDSLPGRPAGQIADAGSAGARAAGVIPQERGTLSAALSSSPVCSTPTRGPRGLLPIRSGWRTRRPEPAGE